MKNFFLAGLFSSALLFSVQSLANDKSLTGDTKLACEAVLCLSSGDRPGECSPSLQRYFSINHKKLSDTLKARKNFLQKCPSSNEQGMSGLINSLANGAGRCDANDLNRVNRRLETFPNPEYVQCTKNTGNQIRKNKDSRLGKQDSCDSIPPTVTKYEIDNKRPSYCTAYFEHGWTYKVDAVKYIGDKYNGGKWVNK